MIIMIPGMAKVGVTRCVLGALRPVGGFWMT